MGFSSSSVLAITVIAGIPFVDYPSEQWPVLYDFLSNGSAVSYNYWVDKDGWCEFEISTDGPVSITLEPEEQNPIIFDVESHTEFSCNSSTSLTIQGRADVNYRLEVTQFFRVVTDNTRHLDRSSWFLLLGALAIVVDVYAIRKSPQSQVARQFPSFVGKLVVVLLFPLRITYTQNDISYRSALMSLGFWGSGYDAFSYRIAGPSRVIMLLVLCIPGILLALQLRDGLRKRVVAKSVGVALAATLFFSSIPLFIFHADLKASILAPVLILFILGPLVSHLIVPEMMVQTSSVISRRRTALASAMFFLAFLLPFGWHVSLIPHHSNTHTFWAPLWTATSHEYYMPDIYGIMYTDTVVWLEPSTGLLLIASLLLSGVLVLYAIGIDRYLLGFERRWTCFIYGVLGVLLSWAPLELYAIFTEGPIVPFQGALHLVIPLPVFLLVGLLVLQTVSPLKLPETSIDPEDEELLREMDAADDFKTDLQVPRAFLVRSLLRKLKSKVFKKRENPRE